MRSRIPNSELDLLSQVPLFANCSKKELREIANLGTPIDVSLGAVLTDEREVGSEFFLLLDGEAVCKVRGRTKAVRKTGDYFGELSLLDGGPRTATITTTEDCRLLVFNRKEFGALLRSSPSIALKLLSNLSIRLRESEAAAGTH
jgi:CRP/FNR family transcriptional regulator, cyclic AMP receptor protein